MQPLQYDLRVRVFYRPHPSSSPYCRGGVVARNDRAAATLPGKTQGFVLRLPPQNKAHATIMQPLQCVFAAPPTHPCSHYHAICIHTLQNTKGEPIRPRNDRSRTRRTQEVPFIAGCIHITRPTSSMQPLQCDLHPHVAEHKARRSRARRTQDTLHGNTQDLVLRLPPQNKAHATIMPPLQCVLQHHVANLHVPTHMATEHDQNQTAITVRPAVRD